MAGHDDKIAGLQEQVKKLQSQKDRLLRELDEVEEIEAIDAQQFRVLVAEDNELLGEHVSRILSPHWEVILCRDGHKAWKATLELEPDLDPKDARAILSELYLFLREMRSRDAPRWTASARAREVVVAPVTPSTSSPSSKGSA